MWAGIIALFPTIAGWINMLLGWFQAREKAQEDQNNAVDSAVKQHDQDGAQSVADRNSSDAQNDALTKQEQIRDNPTPVVVVKQGDK
jgi:hypothetical protein